MKLNGILLALAFALPAPAIAQTDAAAKIDAIFSTITNEQPGCAIGVSQDGKTVIEKAYGLAVLEHGVPNTPATLFEIGSVSKQFTAAALLLLERDGKLKLSDDIRKYLPEMPDYGTTITIEMLLNHTSGLRDWGNVAGASGKGRGDRTFSNAEVLDIAKRQKSLNHKPGAAWSYTNTGYNLATIIAERVSGKSFMVFTKERMFDPLGMTTTQWRDDYNRIVKGRAMAYVPFGAIYKQSMPFMNVYGNGGLMMTIGDLTRWNEAMMTDTLGLRAAMEKTYTLTTGRQTVYARGVTVGQFNGVAEVSHSGSTGGYSAWLARYPDRKLSVAMLCNAPMPQAGKLSEINALFLGAEPDPAEPAGLPDPTPYAGQFVNGTTGYPMTLTIKDGELKFNNRTWPRASSTEWRSGDDAFIFQNANTFRQDTSDGNQFTWKRTPKVTPTVKQLAEYTGRYRSDEALATYVIAVENGQLKARIANWPDTVLTLTPAYKDAFMAGGTLIRFRRSANGKINALSLGDGRMWDLRAARQK